MPARRWLLALLMTGFLATGPLVSEQVASAQAACTFTLGFRAIRDQIPDIVGNCLENERFNPANGNTEQRTTGGLLVWRKADNFTMFTDGATTWINGPSGLQNRANNERFEWEAATPVLAPALAQRCTQIAAGYATVVVATLGTDLGRLYSPIYDGCVKVALARGSAGVDCLEAGLQGLLQEMQSHELNEIVLIQRVAAGAGRCL